MALAYDPNMPESLPPLMVVRHFIRQLFLALLSLARIVCVTSVWLALMPWFTMWTWNMYFTMGDSVAWTIADRPYPPPIQAWVDGLGSNTTSSVSNSTTSSLPTNATFITRLNSHPFWDNVAADIFGGQIIASCIIVLFVSIFLLREWVVQNLPLAEDRRRPDADGQPGPGAVAAERPENPDGLAQNQPVAQNNEVDAHLDGALLPDLDPGDHDPQARNDTQEDSELEQARARLKQLEEVIAAGPQAVSDTSVALQFTDTIPQDTSSVIEGQDNEGPLPDDGTPTDQDNTPTNDQERSAGLPQYEAHDYSWSGNECFDTGFDDESLEANYEVPHLGANTQAPEEDFTHIPSSLTTDDSQKGEATETSPPSIHEKTVGTPFEPSSPPATERPPSPDPLPIPPPLPSLRQAGPGPRTLAARAAGIPGAIPNFPKRPPLAASLGGSPAATPKPRGEGPVSSSPGLATYRPPEDMEDEEELIPASTRKGKGKEPAYFDREDDEGHWKLDDQEREELERERDTYFRPVGDSDDDGDSSTEISTPSLRVRDVDQDSMPDLQDINGQHQEEGVAELAARVEEVVEDELEPGDVQAQNPADAVLDEDLEDLGGMMECTPFKSFCRI
jgi:E3 ubiquitin-protein ligase MARCH6